MGASSFTFVLEHAFPSQPLKMSNVPVRPLTPTSTEKHDPVELEQAPTSKSVDSWHNDIDPEFSPDEQRRIVRRIDRRLIVTCGLMYCISLMDRTNLSNAAIAGMVVELNLIGFRYSTIALVFFATYTLCQPPATVMCRIWPKAIPSFHHLGMGNSYDRIWFSGDMGSNDTTQTDPRSPRSWLLPRLCLSHLNLVHEI